MKSKFDSKTYDENYISTLKYFITNNFAFVKNYQSPRKTEKYKKAYSCYHEREWRFVPSGKDFDIDEDNDIFALPFVEYNQIEEFNSVANKIKLKFETKDIKYLIVENQEDLQDMILFIKENYNNETEIETLISKILIYNEIEEDF